MIHRTSLVFLAAVGAWGAGVADETDEREVVTPRPTADAATDLLGATDGALFWDYAADNGVDR